MGQREADLSMRINSLEYELYDKPGIDECKRRQEAGEVLILATPESLLSLARSTAARLAELFAGMAARLEATGDRDISTALDEAWAWENDHEAKHGEVRKQIRDMHSMIDSLS
jgi:hypothetical protein